MHIIFQKHSYLLYYTLLSFCFYIMQTTHYNCILHGDYLGNSIRKALFLFLICRSVQFGSVAQLCPTLLTPWTAACHDFRLCYKVAITKIIWYWHKKQKYRSMEQGRKSSNKSTYRQFIYNKGNKIIQQRKGRLFNK